MTLVPEASQLGVRCAPTGSVTVLKTIGMLLVGLLDPVASGVQRRVLDDGGHGHRLLLVGVGAEGQGHAKGQGTEGQPFILIGLHHAAIS